MNATSIVQVNITRLKQLIENKVAWGNSARWTHQDFNELSERIWRETQIKLSTTTLKRLWGKVDYRSQPTTNTLNVLAQFAGYEHWRDFTTRQPSDAPLNEEYKWVQTKRKFGKRGLVTVGLFTMLITLAIGFNRWVSRPLEIDHSKVSFYSEPVTKGLPNTVIFYYDVSQLSYDQVEIQQSWDNRLRRTVDKRDSIYTTTYYYPGYFRAKLLVEDQVIEEHDVYVTSNGWLALIGGEEIPHYLTGNIKRNGTLSVSPERLQPEKLLSQEEGSHLAYYNVQDFGDLSSSNFTLETAIRSDYNQGEAVCQESQVSVLCAKGRIAIPWSIPGCVGNIYLAASEQYLNGETADLSAFGCDLSEWQHIRLKVEQQQLSVYRNEQLVFQTTFEKDAGKVAGIRYRFQGAGSVDYVRLLDENEQEVFQDDFNN